MSDIQGYKFDVLALDESFQVISPLLCTNIQWNRKYYECGDFVIEIPADQYIPDQKYIYATGRDQLGIINKISWVYKTDGKFITLSGFFAEKMLDDKIIYPLFIGNGEITSVLKSMANQFKGDLPIHSIIADNTGDRIDFQETGAELGKKIYEILQTQEMSYRLSYNFENNSFDLHFYKGIDRTQEQTENNFVVFSTLWNNLIDPQFDMDDSNYKNYAVVAGSGEGDERIVEIVDLSDGNKKKEVFIDARDLSYETDKQSLVDYKAALRQRGLEKLLEYQVIENVVLKPKGDSYEYLKDFDLGDRCDCVIEDLKKLIQIRIVAVHEVIKNGEHSIELEIGNQTMKGVV